MVEKQSLVSMAAEKLAGKLYDGILFFLQTKVDELVNVLPELAGIAIIICGIIMMFGDLRTWLARTGIVAVVGTTLVVLF